MNRLTDDVLGDIKVKAEAAKSTRPGRWYTVDPPWRASHYDRDRGEHVSLPTYVVSGTPDPHGGKFVVEAGSVEEWTDAADHDAQVRDTDIILDHAARMDPPTTLALLDEIERLRGIVGRLPKCVVCGTPCVTHEDGGPECELTRGVWTCSQSCWDIGANRAAQAARKGADHE